MTSVSSSTSKELLVPVSDSLSDGGEDWERLADKLELKTSEQEACFHAVLNLCESNRWHELRNVRSLLKGLTNWQGKTILSLLVQAGKQQTVEQAFSQRLVEQLSNGQENSLLHIAIRYGWPDMVDFLLGWSDINAPFEGQTALHTAIINHQSGTVKKLLKQGAALNITTEWKGYTLSPIALAVATGAMSCLNTIHGRQQIKLADEKVTNVGNLLHLAILCGQQHSLEYLLQRYAKEIAPALKKVNSYSQTPLILAAIYGRAQAISALGLAGSDLEAVDKTDATSLKHAVQRGQKEVVNILCSLGAKVENQLLQTLKESIRERDKVLLQQIQMWKDRKKLVVSIKESPLNAPPIYNLIFKGGKQIGSVSTLVKLHQLGLCKKVRRVGGVGMGAIPALLYAFGYAPDKIMEIIKKAPLKKELASIKSKKLRIPSNRLKTSKFIDTGICRVERISSWITDLIKKRGTPPLTLRDLNKKVKQGGNYKHLYLFAEDVQNRKVVTFSSEAEKDHTVIITELIQACLSFRGIFHPKKMSKRSGRFVAASYLFPVNAFDHKRYVLPKSNSDKYIYNERTLGLRPYRFAKPLQDTISSVQEWFDYLLCDEAYHRDLGRYNAFRTIEIEVSGKTNHNLISSGKRSAQIFYQDSKRQRLPIFRTPKGHLRISYLPRPTEYLIEQGTVVPQLLKALKTQAWGKQAIVQVLAGQIGVGKTELACRFANDNRSKFSFVHWIPSDTEQKRHLALIDLANLLGISMNNRSDYFSVQQLVYRKLETLDDRRPWLLVFDHLNGHQSLPKRGGFILITADTELIKPKDFPHTFIPVNPLTSEQGLQQLIQLTEKKNNKNLSLIVEKLNGIEVAIWLAAAYLVKEGCSAKTYLSRLNKKMKIKGPSPDKSAQAVWKVTEDAIADRDIFAVNWLSVCACLDWERIPIHWVGSWLRHEQGISSSEAHQKGHDLLITLRDYNLIHYPHQGYFSLHRLIQRVITPLKRDYNEALSLVDREKPGSKSPWLEKQVWLSNAETLLLSSTPDTKEGLSLYPSMGKLYESMSLLDRAYNSYKKGSQIIEESEKVPLFEQLQSLAGKLGFRKESAHIARHLHELKKNRKRKLATEISKLCSVGRSRLTDFQFKKAEQHYNNALKLASSIYEENDGHLIPILTPLANIYYQQGQYQEALRCQIRLGQLLSANHQSLCRHLKELGDTYQALGNFSLAKKHYKESLKLSFLKQDRGSILLQLGQVHIHLGMHNLALENMEEALPLFKDTPEKHALALSSLGVTFMYMNKPDQAKKHCERALKLIEGKKNLSLDATLYLNLARIFLHLNEAETAREYAKNALRALPQHLLYSHSILKAAALHLIAKSFEPFKIHDPKKRLVNAYHIVTQSLNHSAVEHREAALTTLELLYFPQRKATVISQEAVLSVNVLKDPFLKKLTKEEKCNRLATILDLQPDEHTNYFDQLSHLIDKEEWPTFQLALPFALELTDNEGHHLFHNKVKEGKVKAVKHLIHKGWAKFWNDWEEALHLATWHEHEKMASMLLKHCSSSKQDKQGCTPLYYAIRRDMPALVNLMLKDARAICRYTRSIQWTPIATAVKFGAIESYQILCLKVPPNEERVPGMGSLLHVAVYCHQFDMFATLLKDPSISVDIEDDEGRTALAVAAMLGDQQAIYRLHNLGAKLEKTDKKGWTSLHWAVNYKQLAAIEALCRLGAKMETKDHQKKTPLDFATKSPAILSLLQRLRIKPNISSTLHATLTPQNIVLGGSWPELLGGVKALEQTNKLSRIKRCGGSGHGAFIALMLAFNCSTEMMKTLLSLTSLPYSRKKVEEWTEQLCGNSRCTFGQLADLIAKNAPYRHLHLFVLNDRERIVDVNSENQNWKDKPIADAVLEASDNFQGAPVNAFDSTRYLSYTGPFVPAYHHQTLGMTAGKPSRSFPLILEDVLDRPPSIQRTIHLPSSLTTLDFNLSKEQFDLCLNAGRQAVNLYLNKEKRNHISIASALSQKKLSPLIGQHSLIKDLKKILTPKEGWKSSNKTVCFTLLGDHGSGKGVIARRALDLQKYTGVYWIDGSLEETLYRDYHQLAQHLGCLSNKNEGIKQLILSVNNHLSKKQSKKPWLMIFSNISRPPLIPEKGGFVLCTSSSRLKYWAKKNPQRVPPLNSEKLIHLLEKESGQRGLKIQQIAKLLKGNPVAATMAGRYIHLGTKVEQCLKSLRKEKALHPIENALKIAHSRIKQYADALSWLKLLAHFHYTQIPIGWIERWIQSQEKTNKNTNERVNILLNKLKEHLFIHVDSQKGVHFIKPAVQKRLHNFFHIAPKKIVDILERESVDSSQELMWLPHAVKCTPYASFKILKTLGRLQKKIGNYRGACHVWEKALNVKGGDKNSYVPLRYQIAKLWVKQNKPNKAKIHWTTLKDHSSYALESNYRLGDLALKHGHLNSAEKHFKQIITRQGNKLFIARAHREMGRLKSQQMEWKFAIRFYIKSLKGLKKHLLEAADVFHELGKNYENIYEYREALTMFLKALKLKKKSAPPESILTSEFLVAKLALKLQRYDLAADHFDNIQEELSETPSRHLAEVCEGLGDAQRHLGRIEETFALNSYHKALSLFKELEDKEAVKRISKKRRKIQTYTCCRK